MPPPLAPPEQLPDRGEGADVRLKNIGGELIEAGEDGRGLREAIRRQEREPDSPITEWRADSMPEAGSHESWGKQIRRASESMYQARLAADAGLFNSCASPAESLPRAASRSRCCSTRVISRIRSDMIPTKRVASSGILCTS